MKILFIIGEFHPLIGGAQIQAKRLAEELTKLGHKITVFTSYRYGLKLNENINGVDVYRFKAFGFKKIKMLSFSYVLYKEVKKRGREFDIIHVHQAHYPAFSGSAAASRINKTCIIKTGNSGRSFDLKILRESFPWGIGKFMAESIVKSPSLFVAINEQISRDLTGIGIEKERISFIPNGIEPENEIWPDNTLKYRKKLGLPEDVPVFICSASLKTNKNHELLLKAAKELKDKSIRFRMVFLGNGPLFKVIKKSVIEKHLDDYVKICGFVNNVKEYLYAGSFFILSSKAEGISNALLESMSAGLPCAVSDIPGNNELILNGKTGLTFKSGDLQDCLQAILKYLNDPVLAQELGKNAREFVREKFNMNNVAKQYVELYEKHISHL